MKKVILILTLSLIAGISGFVLSNVNAITEPIIKAADAAKEESMQKAMANLREAAYKTIPVMEKIGLIMLNIFSESGSASEVLKFIEKSLIPGLETFARVARSVWEVLGLWIFAIPIMLKLVGVFITMLPALANMTAAIAASGAAIAAAFGDAGAVAGADRGRV